MNAEMIGKTIAHLRRQAGYTQKDLAMRIGVSDKAVSKWERGLGLPDIGYLRKLAILLNTDTDSLLAGSAALNNNVWQGVLSLDNSSEVGLNTVIYDKPLLNYLIGYFLLLGIRKILIICSIQEQRCVRELMGDGSKLGVELACTDLSLEEAWKKGMIKCPHTMIVYGRNLLYGVDQTRFFQRAMQHKDAFCLLAFPKHGNQLTHYVKVDETRKIINPNIESRVKPTYDYSYIPFLFCPTDMLKLLVAKETVGDFVKKLIEHNHGYAEVLDRGFVEIQLDNWNDVNEASTFVKIVQEKCGMSIYCLEEIAWRRGMISMPQLQSFVEHYQGSNYGVYIESLCNRYSVLEN